MSSSGKPYKAGEFCPSDDSGYTIQGADGPITCNPTSLKWVAG
jgi:hypothetical protein